MASDINSKVASQLLDLNRNLDKLTAEVKKNTQATKEYATQQEGTPPENENIKSIADSLKGLDGLKEIADNLKKLDLAGISEKLSGIPKSFDNILGGGKFNLGDIAQKFTENKKSGFDVNKILGAFAEGGVAKKEGNYLVGEKGPEIVKLDAGSAVIPLDSKDLINGLSEIPEIAKSIKSKEINLFGDLDKPGIILGGIENIKNRISLNKLREKYEEDLIDQEGLEKDKQNPEMLKKLEKQNNIIQKIIDYSGNKVQNELNATNKEYYDLYKKELPNGLSKDDLVSFNKIWDSILGGLPSGSVNDLTTSKGRLLATKMLLNDKKNASSSVESSDGSMAKGQLGDKSEDTKKSSGDVLPGGESAVKNTPEGLLKSEKIVTGGVSKVSPPEQGESSSPKKPGSDIISEAGGKEAGDSLKSIVKGQADKLISKIIPGEKTRGIISGGLDELLSSGGSENKKSLTNLATKAPAPKPPDLSGDLKGLTSEISGLVKSNVETVKSKISDKVSGLGGKISEKISGGSKQNVSEGDTTPMNLNESIEQIKSLLSRMAVSLEGPLEVTPLDSPFRPNSRKV